MDLIASLNEIANSDPNLFFMNFIDVQGLDLKTDSAIFEICKASNVTSSGTRSVLYVLVIVNILALITVINTWPLNWTDARINKIENDFKNLPDTIFKLKNAKNFVLCDSFRNVLRVDSAVWPTYRRFDIENYQNIRVPILGNAFDVNNLCLVAGLTFVILMVVLRFTLGRELINLRLALNAITKRYPDYANSELFWKNCAEGNWPDILPSINRVRRLHHYNSLSMNEIFNLPPLEISNNRIQNRFSGRALMHMFYFPTVVYFIIIANDIATAWKALPEAPHQTIAFILISLIFLAIILSLSAKCSRLKQKIYKSYADFKNNDYKFKYEVFGSQQADLSTEAS